MTTIRDVARLAGVSPTTVSHVLSNRRPVSEKTREKVLRAIEQTGYVPNAIAQGLVNRRTKVIGVGYPVQELVESNPSLVTLLFSAGNRLRDHGYQLLFITTPHEDMSGFSSLVNSGLLDGIILLEVLLEDPRVEYLKEKDRIPFVLVGRCRDNNGINFVDIDASKGVYEAVVHLIERGHESIVFLGGYPTDFSHSYYAHLGYKKALEEYGIAYNPLLVTNVAQREESAIEAVDELVGNGISFSAIICLSEFVSLIVLRELRNRGLRVPQDLSLISFGNNEICGMTEPTITAISLHSKTLTQMAIDIVVQHLRSSATEPQQVLILPSLTVRGSSGANRSRASANSK